MTIYSTGKSLSKHIPTAVFLTTVIELLLNASDVTGESSIDPSNNTG